jgi:hypothetical protein
MFLANTSSLIRAGPFSSRFITRSKKAIDILSSSAPSFPSYYLLASSCTVMVLIPVMGLMMLNWRIHRAIKKREAFRGAIHQFSRIILSSES